MLNYKEIKMDSNKLLLALFMGTMMTAASAEPALQAEDTLESLSQVRISTSVKAQDQVVAASKVEETKVVIVQDQSLQAQAPSINVDDIDAPIIE